MFLNEWTVGVRPGFDLERSLDAWGQEPLITITSTSTTILTNTITTTIITTIITGSTSLCSSEANRLGAGCVEILAFSGAIQSAPNGFFQSNNGLSFSLHAPNQGLNILLSTDPGTWHGS